MAADKNSHPKKSQNHLETLDWWNYQQAFSNLCNFISSKKLGSITAKQSKNQNFAIRLFSKENETIFQLDISKRVFLLFFSNETFWHRSKFQLLLFFDQLISSFFCILLQFCLPDQFRPLLVKHENLGPMTYFYSVAPREQVEANLNYVLSDVNTALDGSTVPD